MAGYGPGGRRTRRGFLTDAGRLGAGGFALAALPASVFAAVAAELPAVLCARVVHDGPDTIATPPRRGRGLLRRDAGAERALMAAAAHESAILPLSFAATHVGARWTISPSDQEALAVSVRSSVDGRAWSAWLPLHIDGARASGSTLEVYTALASVPRGHLLQYRLEPDAGPPVVLHQLTLSYLNPFDGPTQPVRAERPVPDPPFPFPFRTREQWGADEALRFDADGAEEWPRMYVPVKKLVVHHTAGSNDYTDSAAEVRAVYVYHAQELGWGDIGYNALIGGDGVVYEGRRGRGPARDSLGREALSPGVVAGHAFFHNFGSAGFALIGNFQDTALPEIMRSRLIDLLTYVVRRDGMDPLTLSDFLRSDNVWHRDLPNVAGHRDCVVTECPGDRVYWLLPGIRAAVGARLGSRETARVQFVSAPPFATTTARDLAAAWTGYGPPLPGAAFSQYLERWRFDGAYETVPVDNRPNWGAYAPTSLTALRDLEDGRYTLHVRGRDPLGQESVYESSVSFLVADTLLIDDEDLGQTRRIGAWQRRTDGSGILGESWEEAPAGRGERTFRWEPLVAEAGTYEVWVRWPSGDGRSSNAPYAVAHADGVYEERCDQRGGSGEWTRLGGARVFRFDVGRGGSVALTNDADGAVAADAVRLVLRSRAAQQL